METLQKKYNIIYICDKKYVFPTIISIRSLIKYSENKNIVVLVIGVEINEQDKKKIEGLSNANVLVNVFIQNDNLNSIGNDHPYVSKAALYKFKIAELFPEIDKALYVDSDVIFCENYLSIFEYDLSNQYMAAVRDINIEFNLKRAGKFNHEHYYNSGVMLLNFIKIRKDNCTQKLIDYKKNDTEKLFMDQDAINSVFGDNAIQLSPKYNYLAILPSIFSLQEISKLYNVSEEEMNSIIDNPCIIHFAGGLKPWDSILSDTLEKWIYMMDDDELMLIIRSYLASIKNVFTEMKQNVNFVEFQNNEARLRIDNLESQNYEANMRIANLEKIIDTLSTFTNKIYRHSLRGMLSIFVKKMILRKKI